MRYSGSLVKSEREKIFRLFAKDESLSFTRIEKATGLRSNKLAYHLLSMQKEGLLRKEGHRLEENKAEGKTDIRYKLTVHGEKYLPIISQITGESLGLVPVLLIAAEKNGKVLLKKRSVRPYKDYWSLPGGKMLHGESIADGAKRIMTAKSGVSIDNIIPRAIMIEHVEEKEMIKHSFLLIFVTGKIVRTAKRQIDAKIDTKIVNPKKTKLHIIPSDHHLITKKMRTRISIPTIILEENPLRMKSISR